MVAKLNEQLLDERLASLEKARPWSPRLVSKLESHIRAAEDDGLFRINPFTFASDRGLPESEVIDLLLHASALGLFGLDWQLLCQQCSCIVESFHSLTDLHIHFHCNLCQTDYEASLDDYIAVTFTVSPEIRDIAFHHPEGLSPQDYFLKLGGTPDGLLPDGTRFIDFQASVTKAIGFLPPGETTRFAVEAGEGFLLGASPEGRAALLCTVEGPRASGEQLVEVDFDQPVREHESRKIAPGPATFAVANKTAERGTFVLAQLPPGFEFGHVPMTFRPFLTGKRLLTTQAFRDLFRSEVIRASEGIGIKDIALLFTDLKGSTALYDRIGDLNAFSLVQQHFDRLQKVTIKHGGAIIKTIGDAVMAAFLDPAEAVAAALEMRTEIAAFNRGQVDRELILKIGVHKGAAIAVTLNDRLDYFGQTVNIAARVQHLADADEIWLSDAVHQSAGVAPALASLSVDSTVAKLRGIQQDMRVFRIAAPAGRESRA
jgi:class 3 adenylate cyclase